MGQIVKKTIKFDQKQSIWAKGGQKTINFDQKTIHFDQNNNGAASGGAPWKLRAPGRDVGEGGSGPEGAAEAGWRASAMRGDP